MRAASAFQPARPRKRSRHRAPRSLTFRRGVSIHATADGDRDLRIAKGLVLLVPLVSIHATADGACDLCDATCRVSTRAIRRDRCPTWTTVPPMAPLTPLMFQPARPWTAIATCNFNPDSLLVSTLRPQTALATDRITRHDVDIVSTRTIADSDRDAALAQ